MYGIAIVGGIVGIPGTIGGRPGYDITMKPTLKKILHISTLDEKHISVHNTVEKPSLFADKSLDVRLKLRTH